MVVLRLSQTVKYFSKSLLVEELQHNDFKKKIIKNNVVNNHINAAVSTYSTGFDEVDKPKSKKNAV
jgi:hypothetical protein